MVMMGGCDHSREKELSGEIPQWNFVFQSLLYLEKSQRYLLLEDENKQNNFLKDDAIMVKRVFQ